MKKPCGEEKTEQEEEDKEEDKINLLKESRAGNLGRESIG